MNLSLFFPPFRCWLQAAKLTIAAYSGAIVIVFYFWLCVALLALLICLRLTFPLLCGVAFGCFAVGWLWFLTTRWLWAVLLRLLWSKPPAWIAPRPGLRAGWYGYCIMMIATLPLVVIAVVQISAEIAIEEWAQIEITHYQPVAVSVMLHYFWLFWFIAAHLLYWFPLPAAPAAPAGNHAIAK